MSSLDGFALSFCLIGHGLVLDCLRKECNRLSVVRVPAPFRGASEVQATSSAPSQEGSSPSRPPLGSHIGPVIFTIKCGVGGAISRPIGLWVLKQLLRRAEVGVGSALKRLPFSSFSVERFSALALSFAGLSVPLL